MLKRLKLAGDKKLELIGPRAHGLANFGVGRFAESRRDKVSGLYEPVHIHSGLNAHPVQHVYQIFSRHVSRCTFGVRAPTKTSH